MRKESEIQALGDQNTPSFASTKENDETRIDLRYQYSGASFLNDAHLTYEDAQFNPRPVTIEPGYRLTTGDRNDIILNLGGGEDYQDKGQKGWAIQDDLTFTASTGWRAHGQDRREVQDRRDQRVRAAALQPAVLLRHLQQPRHAVRSEVRRRHSGLSRSAT